MTESYSDKNYSQSKNLIDAVRQCFEDYKYGVVHGGHSWNMLSEKIHGCTIKFLGENLIQIMYHRYEVGTQETIVRLGDEGQKFLEEVEKGLKKCFKEKTGATLKLKKVNTTANDLEKASRLSAETSWMLGSSRYGYGARPVGRYLVRDLNVYEVDSSL